MSLFDLKGKKIVAFRGITVKNKYSGKEVTELSCILFDDKETILQLSEQDYYDHHDCSEYARLLQVERDAKKWKKMFDKEDNWAEADSCDFAS